MGGAPAPSPAPSPPFTLVLNEPINHLRLLTVLITLALELVEQLFTVSASQAINYGDCRQAVTSTSQDGGGLASPGLLSRGELSEGSAERRRHPAARHRPRPLRGDRLRNLVRGSSTLVLNKVSITQKLFPSSPKRQNDSHQVLP